MAHPRNKHFNFAMQKRLPKILTIIPIGNLLWERHFFKNEFYVNFLGISSKLGYFFSTMNDQGILGHSPYCMKVYKKPRKAILLKTFYGGVTNAVVYAEVS